MEERQSDEHIGMHIDIHIGDGGSNFGILRDEDWMQDARQAGIHFGIQIGVDGGEYTGRGRGVDGGTYIGATGWTYFGADIGAGEKFESIGGGKVEDAIK